MCAACQDPGAKVWCGGGWWWATDGGVPVTLLTADPFCHICHICHGGRGVLEKWGKNLEAPPTRTLLQYYPTAVERLLLTRWRI